MELIHQELANIARREVKDDRQRELILDYCQLDTVQSNFALAALVQALLSESYQDYHSRLIDRGQQHSENALTQQTQQAVMSLQAELRELERNLNAALARELQLKQHQVTARDTVNRQLGYIAESLTALKNEIQAIQATS